MTYHKWREDFIARAVQHGIPYNSDLSNILRIANTIGRLAVARCNGDYPADNGERKLKTCAKCETGWAPSFIRADGVCGECKAKARLATLVPPGWTVTTHGDPRGPVVKLHGPDGYELAVPDHW